jgi:hypothetical protein
MNPNAITTTNPNKALWERGDFTRIAATMRESGEALVKELGIVDGLEVLDLRLGITNFRFQQGDATDLNELEDDRFHLLISIFGAMFAPAPVRRGQGDGARHAARRSDRDGQLDRQRPDVRGAAAEDQRRIFAAAPGGVRQPCELGRRRQRD